MVEQLAARPVVVSVTAAQTQPPGQPPPGMEPGSDLARRFEAFVRQLKEMVAGVLRLRAAGVPLTLSSDAGIGPHKPHDVLPRAPGQATMVGFSGAEALRMVTSVAADACRSGTARGGSRPAMTPTCWRWTATR